MTFSYYGSFKDRGEARDALIAAKKAQGDQFPDAAVEAASRALDLFASDSVFSISMSGHVDTAGHGSLYLKYTAGAPVALDADGLGLPTYAVGTGG